MDDFDTLVRPQEGSRLRVYDDATGEFIVPGYNVIGHPTIGIGRALDTHGINLDEQELLYQNDKQSVIKAVLANLPWMANLDPVRAAVINSMGFQLGVNGLLSFRAMLASVEEGDYAGAATAMMNSQWARQIPARATMLAKTMSDGIINVSLTS